jgi:ElaA protein
MKSNTYQWQHKNFKQLSTCELYEILKLRMEVFIIEQQSIYLDLDNIDHEAIHFMGWDKKVLVAYGRVFLAKDRTAYIQRVLIKKNYRQNYLGSTLLSNMLDYIAQRSNINNISLNAQFHLQKFYEKYHFVASGQPFDDTGILHIKMTKKL